MTKWMYGIDRWMDVIARRVVGGIVVGERVG